MTEKGLQPDNADAYIGLDPVADFSDIKSEYAKGAYSAINLRYTDIPAENLIHVSVMQSNVSFWQKLY